jgi:hypothetical protein
MERWNCEIGMPVQWDSRKRTGETMKGVVVANRSKRRATVETTDGGRWTVSYGLLSATEETAAIKATAGPALREQAERDSIHAERLRAWLVGDRVRVPSVQGYGELTGIIKSRNAKSVSIVPDGNGGSSWWRVSWASMEGASLLRRGLHVPRPARRQRSDFLLGW